MWFVTSSAEGMDIPREMTQDDATALFASLEPVTIPEILGRWTGRGIATGHPLDALLDVSGWVGKRFDGPDDVHPLIHRSILGQISINPGLLPLWLMRRVNMAKWPLIGPVFYVIGPALRTAKPRARLRMVAHQGVSSAAMVYDQKAIIDHFRRIDETRLMGMMDLRGDMAPFFFLLERS